MSIEQKIVMSKTREVDVLMDSSTISTPSMSDVVKQLTTENAFYTIHDDEQQTTPYACYCYDFIVEAVFMGTLCLLGFAGNTVATVCLRRDKSKTATPFLLVSLEVADTLFLIAVFGLRVLTSIDTFAYRLPWLDPAVPFIGKFVYPLALVAETGTIYLTILVTVNRYVSVCWPYNASDWCSIHCARKHVCAVAVFSIIFNLPRFFEYDIVFTKSSPSNPALVIDAAGNGSSVDVTLLAAATTVLHQLSLHQIHSHNTSSHQFPSSVSPILLPPSSTASSMMVNSNDSGLQEDGQLKLKMTEMCQHWVYKLVYTNLLYFFVMFLLPLVSLTFLNQRLIVALRRTKKKRQRLIGGASGLSAKNSVSGGDSNRSEEDITFMLIVVVMVFVVTQAPAAVTQFIQSNLDDTSMNCPSPFFFYERISDLFVVINSSINFVIYCLCSRRFRQILTDIACRCMTPGDADEGPADERRPAKTNGAGRSQWPRRGDPVDVNGLQARRSTATTRFDVTAAVPLTCPAGQDDNELISPV